MLNGFKQSLGLMTDSWADNVLDRYINKGVNQVRAIDNEVALLNAHMEESRKKLIKIEVEKNTKGVPPPPDDEDKSLGLLVCKMQKTHTKKNYYCYKRVLMR